jgi:thiamine-phosphate pyrophosphorylase
MPAEDLRNVRLARLAAARLYLVCDTMPGGHPLRDFLPMAISGGVEIVQLRVKDDSWREDPYERRFLLEASAHAAEMCGERGALFVVNDYPEIALEAGADGVHVGQEDMPARDVRELMGEDMLIGLSTHAPSEIDAADPALVDYIGVGPVHTTPTKPGRPAVGVELVRYAAAHAAVPFFAIGGLDAHNVGEVLDAGASRVCVLRAVADAESPEYAARELRRLLDAMPLDAPPIDAEGQA